MPKTSKRPRSATLAIHAGEDNHGRNTPVSPPIVRSSTFTLASSKELKRYAEGKSKAYMYTRYGNPTLAVAEAKLAALEGGEAALVLASGMAAISTSLLSALRAGDELIATRKLYGGSYRLMRDVLPGLGIRTRYVEADLAGVEKLVNERTRVLYVETPTNPTLEIVDLRRAAALARRYKLISMVDSTFGSPVLQRPLEFGFDLSLHSATKYLGGHSDLVAGAVIGSREMIGRIRELMMRLGGNMDPAAAFLLNRGLKTLELRVRRQSETALKLARFLSKHPKVASVHYPGLPSHPNHRLAKSQMDGFGGMLAFDVKGGLAAARRVCDRTRIFQLAVSLGGVESLIMLPLYSSHYGMSAKELAAVGVTPGTIRLSTGLEDPADLIADLKQALA
jgi:cystathionine beta-lyase/cystathionine gamma-synthase